MLIGSTEIILADNIEFGQIAQARPGGRRGGGRRGGVARYLAQQQHGAHRDGAVPTLADPLPLVCRPRARRCRYLVIPTTRIVFITVMRY